MNDEQPVSKTLPLFQGESPQGEGVSETQLLNTIITALCKLYQPTGNAETMELKTTADLADEMSAIADIGKNEISAAMQHAGFTLKYTPTGVFWVLYPVN